MRTPSILISTMAVIGSLTGAGVAEAVPSNAPSSTTAVGFDCGTAGTYSGFANSGNSQALTWNPFFLSSGDGSARVLVPTANDLVVRVNGVIVFAPSATKASSVGSVVCEVTGGSGPVTVGGSITGNLSPIQ